MESIHNPNCKPGCKHQRITGYTHAVRSEYEKRVQQVLANSPLPRGSRGDWEGIQVEAIEGLRSMNLITDQESEALYQTYRMGRR